MGEPTSLRIAVLLDQVETDYHLEVLAGIRKVCLRAGARIVVVAGGALGQGAELRNFVYDILPETQFDGLVVLTGCLSNHSGTEVLSEFLAPLRGRPLITIGVAVPELPTVHVDNGFGVRKLLGHLIEEHRATRIAFLRGPHTSIESEARFAGYRAALEAHGLALDHRLVVEAGLERDDGARGVGVLLDERGFRPGTLDAIACFNDEVALGAIEELHRRNIGVPQPIAVVGFDDEPVARVSNPPLSTVKQGAREQGEAAARALLTALSDGGRLENEAVDTQVVIRDSCGCRLRLQNDSRSIGSDRPRVARTCRLALIERRAAIRSELARAAAGRLVGSHDWEGRLIDSLAAQLDSEEGGAFLWEFERIARLHQSGGGDPLVSHDVLSALRLQALVCAEVQPDVRPRLEDSFQEARVLLARVSVAIAHDHLESVGARTRELVRACLEQVGTPDRLALHDALHDYLPRLGVGAFTVSRLAPGHSEWLDVISSKAPRSLRDTSSAASERLHLSSLGIDPLLEGVSMVVVEPLAYSGHPVGMACFAWGALEPSLYEELRDLLSLALSPVRSSRDPASAELLRPAGS